MFLQCCEIVCNVTTTMIEIDAEDVESVLLETDATGYLYKQSTMRRM